ncbi:MAG TPA: methyltransferase domain-containing protein [Gemmatimonadaceae bacterium]|nr:methyltransferase domain-containing protein [Gemmatimonadaceae bacterium]
MTRGTELTTREEIAAHVGNLVRSEVNRDSDFDLESWIQQRIRLRSGERVLDIGCGNGKQLVVFSDLVGAGGQVIGADIFGRVPGLLDAAKKKLEGKHNVSFRDHDASLPFSEPDGAFNCVTSCYSFYYVRDIRATLTEVRRLLCEDGRFFVVGPSWDNSRELYDLNHEITGRDLPEDFRYKLWRINEEVVPLAYELFDRVEISPWVNRVHFRGEAGIQRATDYYRSSLLFEEDSADPKERERFLAEFRKRVTAHIGQHGVYHMVKRALGITMYKARP